MTPFHLRKRLRALLEKDPIANDPRPPPPRPRAPPPEPEPEPPQLEVEGHELAGLKDPLLLDVREPYETAGGVLRGALLIPMNQVPKELERLPKDRVIVVYCAAGARSYGVAHWLREQGYAEAWSLAGGIGAAPTELFVRPTR